MSHRSAPVDVREKFAGSDPGWAGSAGTVLAGSDAVEEWVVLRTCNRTESYVGGRDEERIVSAARLALREASGMGTGADRYIRTHSGMDAVEHLFEVTSGLNSPVLGEPQVQRQVLEAYRSAAPLQVGALLHRLFQSALSAGSRARARALSAGSAPPLPAVAVETARRALGGLEGTTVLVFGTGPMGRQVVGRLWQLRPGRVIAASSDHDRAAGMGRHVIPMSREQALDAIPGADVLITCASGAESLVRPGHIGTRTPHRPLVALDLAVPRNIHQAVGKAAHVHLHNVDELHEIASRTITTDGEAVSAATAVLHQEVERFGRWWRERAAVTAVRAMRSTASELAGWPGGPPAGPARKALNRVLHGPTRAITWLASHPGGSGFLETLEPRLRQPPPLGVSPRPTTAKAS
ncbi:MAG: glutamyl-tRNA reductase [Gemmatimonadetes bacterium]|nr:glutamyl-tRNA reductase [Gemmatimonadota bacterium]